MLSPRISVLTLVRDREAHLHNLLVGLSSSTVRPHECVIIRMNEAEQPLPATPFPTSQHSLTSADALPLAQARNLAAHKATGTFWVFLDVDCIPAATCLEAYASAHCQAPTAVLMGAVSYLRAVLPAQWWLADLPERSAPHPLRDAAQQVFLQLEVNYNLFWTLSFGLTPSTFEQVGGFCEAYRGYGAEDTDFARLLERSKIELRWVPTAMAYHQYHASQVPPRQHLQSIVRNAWVYYRRWGQWPMEKWLLAFAQEGLIDWQPEAEILRTLP
ncbi:MAG: glycosyltransferase family 2 protein [Leptolyngbya sp. SIO4C5]|nr:glycosyltransferase family 2 protein [Leptolyngbya sp. SIO4C5]